MVQVIQSTASSPTEPASDEKQASPAAAPADVGSGHLAAAVPKARNLAGHNWLARVPGAYSQQALMKRLLGDIQSWRDYPATLRLWFWLIPTLTAAIGGVLRFVRLGTPDSLVFDETYYVKDAYSYLVSGYERAWPDKANDAFNAGNPAVLLEGPEYVVHPPVGKWMIAFGMWLFGADNAFGWRFSAALAGTVSIFLVALIAQKLFRSHILGGLAGLLLAIDGHHLVMSRTSLLDIFLMFWLVAAFGALLLDRDDGRRRLARRLAALAAARPDGRPTPGQLFSGPGLGIRWWRIAAGICMGLAIGTKWSGLFFLAAFGLMTVLWDLSARRIAGIRSWVASGVVKDGLPAFLGMVPVAAAVYVSTWTGWFLSRDAYYRHWADTHPSTQFGWVPNTLRSFAHYHLEAFKFHQGLTSDHPYEASAWTWLVMGRPTSFYYTSPGQGTPGCSLPDCTSAILSVGNPVIWWAAALSLAVLLFWWAGRRDWRAGAVLCGVAAGYLPWFMYPDRTMFFFYAISFEPFLVLALVYCLGLVLGRPDDPPWRRRSGLYFIALFAVVAVLVSAFFYPVWTAEIIGYQEWRMRMWMPSWI